MDYGQMSINIEGLTAGYGGQALFAPLTLHLAPATTVGIIGTNGSGKSTLLRSIFDVQLPMSGTVQLGNQPMNEASLHYRRHLALQVEDGTFFDELSVADHLWMVARGHGLGDPHAAVEAEQKFFGLQEVAGSLPHELSSGQRRKLLLAATLIRPASFVVLDEPEQRLDPQMRAALYQRLSQLQESGTGTVVVSHDAELIRQCTDRVVLLDGQSCQELTAQQAVAWLAR